MPNKRQARNAYFYFVLEKLPELRRRGLPVTGVRDAVPHCSADWALLSLEQREKYSEIARRYKADGDAPSKPCTPPKQLLSLEQRAKYSEIAHRYKADSDARSKPCTPLKQNTSKLRQNTMLKVPFKNLPPEVQRSSDHALLGDSFYFLNIFSHGELPPHCDQRFLPCEIGCIRYTLHEGITDCFHHFIDPGVIPRGFRFHCQAASDNTHQIPLSGFELSNGRYHSLFHELCTFVNPNHKSWPAVYCKSSEYYRVNWCLKWLAEKAGMENKLQLLHVEDLVVELYQRKSHEEPSKTHVRSLLDVFQWDYSSNTRCKWHEDNDILFCALASCKKIAYCISSALASVYEIQLTNAHLPLCDNDPHNVMNPKMVVLDAGRFQRQRNASFGGPRYFSDSNMDHTASINNDKASHPSGVKSSTVMGRGRGIVRLLESFAASNISSS